MAPLSSSGGRSRTGFTARLQDSLGDAAGYFMAVLSGHTSRMLLSGDLKDQQTGLPSPAAAAAPVPAAIALTSSAAHSRRSVRSSSFEADRPSDLPQDPQLDPRALLVDFAVLDEADVVVGLHGAQLYNALFMPAHKALVEVRPFQFTGVSNQLMGHCWPQVGTQWCAVCARTYSTPCHAYVSSAQCHMGPVMPGPLAVLLVYSHSRLHATLCVHLTINIQLHMPALLAAFQLWPDMYFKQPLTETDKNDGIFWFGIDTVKPSNSKPGTFEVQGTGCCHPRDRHTRIEPDALAYLFR